MEESAFPRAYDMHTNRRPKALFMLIVFLLILAALIFLGTRFLGTGSGEDREDAQSQEEATVEATPTPEEQEAPEVTPTPTPEEELDRESLSIQVLNGSGISGAAGELAGVLEELGYTDVTTGNAEAFDHEGISISVTSTKSNFLELLRTDLEDSYTIGDTDTDLTSDTYDAVIIIGE